MSRVPFPRTGLLAALIALAIQLGFAASVPNPGSAFLLGAGDICHGGSAPLAPGQHQPPDSSLCPFCAVLAAPAPIPAAAPKVPLPSGAILARAAVLPPATAPPPGRAVRPQPRGPPFLA